jgi:hypothetical protein
VWPVDAHIAGERHEIEQRLAGGGFAATAFADQRQRLAGMSLNPIPSTACTRRSTDGKSRSGYRSVPSRLSTFTTSSRRCSSVRAARLGFGAGHFAKPRHGGEQRLRIGRWRGKRSRAPARFRQRGHPSSPDAIGHLGDDAHVMGDKDHGSADLRLQLRASA